jgi:hypothetical protein
MSKLTEKLEKVSEIGEERQAAKLVAERMRGAIALSLEQGKGFKHREGRAWLGQSHTEQASDLVRYDKEIKVRLIRHTITEQGGMDDWIEVHAGKYTQDSPGIVLAIYNSRSSGIITEPGPKQRIIPKDSEEFHEVEQMVTAVEHSLVDDEQEQN